MTDKNESRQTPGRFNAVVCTRVLIPFVLAVMIGLGVGYTIGRRLTNRQQEVEMVPVLVAMKSINIGTVISVPEEVFFQKFVPKGEEPKLAIGEFAKLKGQQANRKLRQGDFVTPDDVYDENSFVSWRYDPSASTTVGIRVNPEEVVGGFANLPKSRVDIFYTVRSGSESKSKILLENVLVLAADANARSAQSEQTVSANVVTVALRNDDALKLELAKSLGPIRVVIREPRVHADAKR